MATTGTQSTPTTPRVGRNSRAQIVTIPLAYRSPERTRVADIRKEGDNVILSPRHPDWTPLAASHYADVRHASHVAVSKVFGSKTGSADPTR